jgi:hypothetical protein
LGGRQKMRGDVSIVLDCWGESPAISFARRAAGGEHITARRQKIAEALFWAPLVYFPGREWPRLSHTHLALVAPRRGGTACHTQAGGSGATARAGLGPVPRWPFARTGGKLGELRRPRLGKFG